MVIHVTKENFPTEILKSQVPVMIDFSATWCGPCKMVAPTVEALSQEYAGKAVIGKVDIDEMPELAQAYRVMGVPTLMVFKNGKQVDKIVGAVPKDTIKAMLDKYI